MDDLHFMERLERVAAHQAELALALYRAPELVRYVLDLECAPDQPRIAISLGDPALGPFVIVQRNGRFVTCLATGMLTDLPIITKARLDDLRARHSDFNQRLMFVNDTDQRTMSAVWKAIFSRAHQVPREAMTIATMIAPLMQAHVQQAHITMGQIVLQRLRETDRLVARVDRWSKRDLELLERIWVDTWALAHLILLDYSGRPEDLAERHRLRLDAGSLDSLGSLSVAMSIPFAPLQVRCAWAFARLGPMGVKAARRAFTDMQHWYPNIGALFYMVSALAHASSTTHDDVRALIQLPIEDENIEIELFRAEVLATLERPDRGVVARRLLYDHGRQSSGLTPLYAADLAAEAELARALPLVHRGAVVVANAMHDAFDTRKHTESSLALLPWLVRAEADELYWTQADADALQLSSIPEYSYRLLARLADCPSMLHDMKEVRQAKSTKQGRNDPCACGSGKKHKKCCGA